ncbi:hypothetical protein [Brevibacterium spongiae]|uniref:DUF7847 domain-containing protein n=1 Tax=Brevibacterium spongiae TaxID=2909672 RepID=A0ABY5SS76_9MICO|nr:hypothetical protein [Brevibacterium spongiae]UVI37425.1 hypothetical protein L1F31_07210 [Brevibacterium spongiae]
MAGLAVMGQTNAWTSEVDWRTGQWQRRSPSPPSRGWRPPPPRGLLPKRPLTFIEALDSGFRLLRFIPTLSVGSSLIVFTLWSLLLTAGGALIAVQFLPFFTDLSGNEDALSGFLVLAQLGSAGLSLLSLGLAHLLSGLVATGTRASFGARRTTLSQAWASLSGRRWRLILATLLMCGINLGLLLALTAPTLLFATADSVILAFVWAGLAGLLWFLALIWINLRLAFLGSAIAVEGLSVRAGIKRSWSLTGRGFWRMLGQLALGYFLSNQLVQLIITPLVFIISLAMGIGMATTTDSETAQAAIGIAAAGLLLGLTLVSSAVLFAYFACLVTVCFFDQQMRTEGLDLVLIRAEEDR